MRTVICRFPFAVKAGGVKYAPGEEIRIAETALREFLAIGAQVYGYEDDPNMNERATAKVREKEVNNIVEEEKLPEEPKKATTKRRQVKKGK